MKWIIYRDLSHRPISAHPDLDSAMHAVHNKHLKATGGHNIGAWWFRPQIDAEGIIDWISVELPSRPMTDQELVALAAQDPVYGKRTLKIWRQNVRRGFPVGTPDYDQVEQYARFPSGRFECLSVVREDRATSGMRDSEQEGNDVAEERKIVRELLDWLDDE